ncbi:hypothetical protein ACFL24_01550 [Patescibacteria group bacterium]
MIKKSSSPRVKSRRVKSRGQKAILATIITALIVLLVSVGVLSYVATRKTDTQEATETEEAVTEEEPAEAEAIDSVWMFGRSVMAGWFEYWGSDVTTSVDRKGYTLTYKELYEPPDIVESVKVHLKDLNNKKPAVFFKLCFVDFAGGTRQEASSNLEEHKDYIEEVYDLVVEKYDLKLLIGNTLPQVANDTDDDLVWNHERYNTWLDNFAEEHEDEVAIFDFYGLLTDDSGNLKSGYAVDTYDSHPNSKGYAALEDGFFDFLDESLK